MPGRRHVPAGRNEAIVAAYISGARAPEIAAEHGISPSMVALILRRSPEALAHRRAGTALERRIRDALDPAVPVGDIAATVGCSVEQVYAVALREGVRVGTLRDTYTGRIRPLLDGTRTVREIAEQVGCSVDLVGQTARAAGLCAAPAPSKAATVRRLVNVDGARVDDAAAAVGLSPGKAMEALRRKPPGRPRASV